jgi:hypothetical protein
MELKSIARTRNTPNKPEMSVAAPPIHIRQTQHMTHEGHQPPVQSNTSDIFHSRHKQRKILDPA